MHSCAPFPNLYFNLAPLLSFNLLHCSPMLAPFLVHAVFLFILISFFVCFNEARQITVQVHDNSAAYLTYLEAAPQSQA